jgi:hypothetical protein
VAYFVPFFRVKVANKTQFDFLLSNEAPISFELRSIGDLGGAAGGLAAADP